MESLLTGAATLLLVVHAAQTGVVGVVRDAESGEPLAGAVVALTDLDRAVLSDSLGRYAFAAVPPGPQHLTVRRIGYTSRTLHALVPADGQLEINIALRAAPVLLRAVEVRPNVSVRGLEGSEDREFPDHGLSIAAVRNHPLLAEPDVFLALSGGEVVLRPESPSGIHLRGGASDQTAYLLDGIPVFSPYHAPATFSAWNPDALERVHVSSSASTPALPDALSGVVTAVTRAPGSQFRAQGSVSTTQARFVADGPLGVEDAGYLVSVRSGFPGVIAPRREPSYLKGESEDRLVTIRAPAFGGHVRLLGYESEDELDAAAVAHGADATPSNARRNAFTWSSQSVGMEWSRPVRGAVVRLVGWSASGHAGALWDAEGASPLMLASLRRDEGVLGVVERSAMRVTTSAGLWVRQSRTSYDVRAADGGPPSIALAERTPLATVFLGHDWPIGPRLAANVAFSAAAALGRVYANPQAQLRWSASPRLALSGSFARSHQFAQSLRNPESVVGNMFPVDLYVGAGSSGIPVARSDRGVLAAEYRVLDVARLGAQAYVRDFHGLALVAPRTGEPFVVGGDIAVGAGTARGLSVDAALSRTRYGVVASYGWQRVRVSYGDSSFVPEHATSHILEAGVILFPSATSSIRLGATSALGRRATAVAGAFEWEACNLLDQGCEFGGSPRHLGDQIGATRLPAYLRVDLGARKHWHLDLAGKDAVVALFGSVTNVFGRTNVLTSAADPASGKPVGIEMRPRAPLVVGLDWRF
jgi:hypothetical protein